MLSRSEEIGATALFVVAAASAVRYFIQKGGSRKKDYTARPKKKRGAFAKIMDRILRSGRAAHT